MTRKALLLVFSAFLVSSSLVFSQAQINSSARVFLNEYRKAQMNEDLYSDLIKDYDLIRINGMYYIGVLVMVNENAPSRQTLYDLNIINDTRLDNLWTMRVPIKNFEELIKIAGIDYIEVGEPVSPYKKDAIPSARVDSVHLGLGELSRAYTGKGVIVAVIDWGFDYTHPNFYDTALNELRISRAWDQNKLSGPAPHGYSFGTEYVGQEALLEAWADTLYVFGPSSHGTHVGGIAGGTGAGTPHVGAAFESELIFISLRRDAPSLIDAFSYITDYAESVNKPYVVNMSFGSHLGPHDGTDMKNVGIDNLHGPGRIFVGSAGNNGPRDGSSPFHLDYDFIENPNDTIKTVVEFDNIPGMFGQTLSMWGSEFSEFSVSLILATTSNNILYQTPFYNSANEPFINDTIVVGEDSLIIRTQSTAAHFLNDKPNIRMEVKKTGQTKLVLVVTSPDSHLHIWNNVRMNNRYTNWGMGLTNTFPGAIRGDNDFALGEPAGVGKNVITVGSYMAERIINGNVYLGAISSWSSMGPTVDLRTKPDITSVGHNVVSSMNSFDHTVTGVDATVIFNDSVYYFKSLSGTSMSGPLVSGIVALMLQAHPKLSAVEAKEIIKTTARLDHHTGDIGPEGDLQWGWGKANALAAVRAAELMNYNENIRIEQNIFDIYPNPASKNVNIKLNQNGAGINEIEIFSLDGKTAKLIQANNENSISININDMTPGMYLIRVSTNANFSIKRLIISE